ncbi:hypothetical protein HJFPF1_11264 [Paramyrothecium foliicola]|nr:hypothetical protein HJFPF1_11264 [Paramyrothecium foliicola]
MALSSLLLVLSVLLLRIGSCLEVTPGSSCSSFCLDIGRKDGFDPAASTTNSSEIVCQDLDFSTRDEGVKFKTCLECLQKSEKVNETESDLHWYLYNLRYALSTCLFSIPDESSDHFVNSPCIIEHACRPLRYSLTADALLANNTNTYGYCIADGGSFQGDSLKPCVSCLQASNDQSYLSNFMVALQAGCQQKPEPGDLLSLSGTVFAKDAVNITAPVRDIRDDPEGAGSGTLTTGAIVGIAVGAGLLLLGGIALFIVYWRRQKKFDKEEQLSEFRTYGASPDPFLPPVGGKMSASLRSYSGQGHYKEGQPMSSGDYYDKMEDDIRAGRLQYNYDPRSMSRGPNSALPAHSAYIPQAMSRGPLTAHAVHISHNPAPQAATQNQARRDTADPYNMGSIQPPPPAVYPEHSRRDTSSTIPPPPPGPPTSRRKVPSLVLPAASKLRMPKKYSPPMVVIDGAHSGQREMHISQPVIQNTARFQDMPLAGGVVYAEDARVVEQLQQPPQDYAEVPMKSGKSLLYG